MQATRPTRRPTLRLIAVSAATLLAINVNAAIGAAAPAASTPTTTASARPGKAKPKAQPFVRRSSSSARRNEAKVKMAGSAATVLRATPLPTVTSTAVPLTLPPPTAAVSTTTMPAPVTTTTGAVASFEVVALNLKAEAVAGTAATFSIVIAQRGDAVPVSLSVIGLPAGTSASVGPNPATGLSVVRIAVPSNAVVADYPLRILGTNGSAQSWANVTLGVLPAAITTTTTTIDGSSLAPSFGFTVTPDGKTLVTGGQVQYDIVPIYDTGYNGSIEYFVSGLPDGVWFGFSQKVTTTKTVLWLSSTVAMKAGTFPFTITGVSKGLKKSGEITVTIG